MNFSSGNCSNQILLSKIDSLRKQLITIGLEKGLSSPKTLKVSQELDQLLNLLLLQKK